ncbi:MAG: hypothetical protein ACLRX4_12285 [Oscillospiraceae bacterium]
MLNEIIKGISMALNAAFGDGYKVYQNDVEARFGRTLLFGCRSEAGTFPADWAAVPDAGTA